MKINHQTTHSYYSFSVKQKTLFKIIELELIKLAQESTDNHVATLRMTHNKQRADYGETPLGFEKSILYRLKRILSMTLCFIQVSV